MSPSGAAHRIAGPMAVAAAVCALAALVIDAEAGLYPRRAPVPESAELTARETRALLAALETAAPADRTPLERVLAASLARLKADLDAARTGPDATVERLAVPALLAASAFGALAAAGAAHSLARERRRLDAVLPAGARGEGLAARVERLTGKARHAMSQQASLVGERVELARALVEQQVVEARLHREVRQNRDRIEKLEVAQMNDELTGVLNFRYFLLRLGEALDDFVERGREFCLLALDLDDFKRINDGYGHHVGDAALKEMARLLRATVRREDVVFRKSGDEFYVLMPGAGAEHGEALGERLLRSINGHEVVYEGAEATYRVRLGTSIGVLHCAEVDAGLLTGLARDQLLSETYGFADAALFKAKFSGKGCARIYRTGLTVQGVNPTEYPPELDALQREVRARYPLLPEAARDDFNAHVAACRELLDPRGEPATSSTPN